MTTKRTKLIVALDVDDLAAANRLMDRLQGSVATYKLGAQLLAAAGPEAVYAVRRRGFGVFYDAKFHDIPRTVEKAVAAACRMGATIVNVHASGGTAMMRAAASAAAEAARRRRESRSLVLAVTVLTSLDAAALKEELGVRRNLAGHVVHLAKRAQAAGLDGVVASPLELAVLRKACGPDFVLLTPGIRPRAGVRDDQRRTLTQAGAVRAGADYLVVGRPVVEAKDPLGVVRRILADMEAQAHADG